MSQENVELAYRAAEAFNRRDLDAFLALMDDDVEVISRIIVLEGGLRGHDGVRRWWQNWLDWLEPWATYRGTYEQLIDVGEHVVVLLRNHGRREDMETEVELIGATIFTFREGKLARWGDYAERAAAFEAVGLSEQDAHADS